MPGPSRSKRRSSPRYHPQYIPRPRNAWVIYRAEKAKLFRDMVPPLPQTEISKLIAAAWKAEPEHIRQLYIELSEIEKAEHRAKYPDYKFNPQPKKKSKGRSRRECNEARKQARSPRKEGSHQEPATDDDDEPSTKIDKGRPVAVMPQPPPGILDCYFRVQDTNPSASQRVADLAFPKARSPSSAPSKLEQPTLPESSSISATNSPPAGPSTLIPAPQTEIPPPVPPTEDHSSFVGDAVAQQYPTVPQAASMSHSLDFAAASFTGETSFLPSGDPPLDPSLSGMNDVSYSLPPQDHYQPDFSLWELPTPPGSGIAASPPLPDVPIFDYKDDTPNLQLPGGSGGNGFFAGLFYHDASDVSSGDLQDIIQMAPENIYVPGNNAFELFGDANRAARNLSSAFDFAQPPSGIPGAEFDFTAFDYPDSLDVANSNFNPILRVASDTTYQSSVISPLPSSISPAAIMSRTPSYEVPRNNPAPPLSPTSSISSPGLTSGTDTISTPTHAHPTHLYPVGGMNHSTRRVGASWRGNFPS